MRHWRAIGGWSRKAVRYTVSREPWLYGLFAGLCTFWVASAFVSSMQFQLFLSSARAGVLSSVDQWSAPLDDVFIHFDFARSTARGYPFEWSEGNGYSSGGTSLLYPWVLAVGYFLGFSKARLMSWAIVVACVSVLGTLIAGRRIFRRHPIWTSYTLPLMLLSVGALSWTLFSGMEVALFLCVWAWALIAWDDLRQIEATTPDRRLVDWALASLPLGLANALLVATRPEAAALVAVFSFSAAWAIYRRVSARGALACLVLSAMPGALITLAHALANRWYTGDWSAAGALAKLEMHHPYLSQDDVFNAWVHFLKYQILRVTNYHFADVLVLGGLRIPGLGWIVWGLAAIGLFAKRSRDFAVLLWVSLSLWMMTVALNGQVRWQNERYTMPAVAWLLMAASLGLATLMQGIAARFAAAQSAMPPTKRRAQFAVAMASLAALALVLWAYAEAGESRFRGQVWFFGRASRNIHDQHMEVGQRVRALQPRRVLVGDAGAIPFESDVPALDIIGLGGYKDFPFARATRFGVAAALELIQRIPRGDRPDLMALYPNWWGDFTLWFGQQIFSVPVRGNVICGGAQKVVYQADWSSLEDSEAPLARAPAQRVVDSLDLADVVSERSHAYSLSGGVGFASMKVLPHPAHPQRDLWDAGRTFGGSDRVEFVMTGAVERTPARLLVRVAPAQAAAFTLSANGRQLEVVTAQAADQWQELSVDLPPDAVRDSVTIQMDRFTQELTVYNAWLLQ